MKYKVKSSNGKTYHFNSKKQILDLLRSKLIVLKYTKGNNMIFCNGFEQLTIESKALRPQWKALTVEGLLLLLVIAVAASAFLY